MSEWAPKRFWTSASVAETDGGYTVTLDGRAIKTPAKTALVVPTKALAEHLAQEWDAQEEVVKPANMPFTRMTNSAIDKVTPQHGEVADMLAAYGDSDLLCYRAATPEELVARQAEVWDRYLDWAAGVLQARLAARTGVMHAPQDPDALARLSTLVHAQDAYALAAFHDLVSMSGSLILAFAVTREQDSPEAIWEASRLDERWQEEQWGVDEDARAVESLKRAEFLHAATYWRLVNTQND